MIHKIHKSTYNLSANCDKFECNYMTESVKNACQSCLSAFITNLQDVVLQIFLNAVFFSEVVKF